MRNAMIGFACLIALLASACARKDPVVASLEGSEPQRLSFGTPSVVQESFARQMKHCWFDGPAPLLGGYQYHDRPAALETADGLTNLRQITIQSGPRADAQRFVVQFFPFNDNTLISTRNFSLPSDLAARLKRDVETWIFGRDDCGTSAGSTSLAGLPGGIPQTSSSAVTHGGDRGWSTSQERLPY